MKLGEIEILITVKNEERERDKERREKEKVSEYIQIYQRRKKWRRKGAEVTKDISEL